MACNRAFTLNTQRLPNNIDNRQGKLTSRLVMGILTSTFTLRSTNW